MAEKLDLIHAKKGKPIQVAERGTDVAYLALEELIINELEKVISERGFVDFVGLEAKIPAPPSILLKSLLKLEKKKKSQLLLLLMESDVNFFGISMKREQSNYMG